ncbi:MAG: STAS domain-containing protein [Candidatus Sumerlaeia bacterium]|nr:STAS domain-containing protein [Candidatus Sumerlaeia bacterium]
MEFKVEATSQTQIIHLSGELVADNSHTLREMVMGVSQKNPREIILNLSEVPFIDTSGLGTLVGLRASLRSKDIALRLTNATERVIQNLKMTRLDLVFGIES